MSGISPEEDVSTATVDTVVDKPSSTRRPEDSPPPARVDRFVILDKVGEGGMSTVYAAYDTLLDRKVALKVLRPDREASHTTPRRDRLLREAQAMARLHHPNVVAVLDVGELGNDVYIALELVDGETLSEWFRGARRPWRAVVAHFVEAARGLIAAHAVGLVHRDVKPDNMLLGKDGRTRITDFGVVSMHQSDSDSGSTPRGDDDLFSGLRVGTPAYMAPEQFAGLSVDARADQFAFCVSLWEGLFGQRPFGSLRKGMKFAERPFQEPPKQTDVPAWLIAALRRGLSLDPEARWPSLEALVAELTVDRTRTRKIVLASALAAVSIASVTLALVAWTRDRAPTPELCTDEQRHLAGIWDDDRAESLAATLRSTGGPGAAAVAARARDQLGTWFRTWVAERTSACAATRVHGDQSEAMLDLRMRCLDRKLVETKQLVRELFTFGATDLQRTTEITADLPDLHVCADPDQLTAVAPVPSDPILRGRIAAVEEELAKVAAIERRGRYPDALALAIQVSAHASAIGFAPLEADALATVGRLRAQTGDHAAAITTLREASVLAATAHADDIAASAAVELVWATFDSGHNSEALALVGAVAPMVARVHDRALEAALASEEGDALGVAGDLAGATKELQHALEIDEATLGADHVRVAQVLNRLGAMEDRQHHSAQARQYYSRALTIVEARLGPEHPSAAVTRANLCYLDASEKHLDSAATCYEHVIATLEAALGKEHPQVAWALNDASLVASARGRDAEARAGFERARDIYMHTSNGQNPDIAWPLVNLGDLALKGGDAARAEALCRQALDVTEAADPKGETTFSPLVCLAGALAARDPAKSIELAERALQMETAQFETETRAQAHFAIARAALARADRARARADAEQARAAFDESGATSDRDEVVAWIKRNQLSAH